MVRIVVRAVGRRGRDARADGGGGRARGEARRADDDAPLAGSGRGGVVARALRPAGRSTGSRASAGRRRVRGSRTASSSTDDEIARLARLGDRRRALPDDVLPRRRTASRRSRRCAGAGVNVGLSRATAAGSEHGSMWLEAHTALLLGRLRDGPTVDERARRARDGDARLGALPRPRGRTTASSRRARAATSSPGRSRASGSAARGRTRSRRGSAAGRSARGTPSSRQAGRRDGELQLPGARRDAGAARRNLARVAGGIRMSGTAHANASAERTLGLLAEQVGRSVAEVETPVVIVDLDRLEANLTEVQSYADEHGIALWPHTKTHKSPEIGLHAARIWARGLTVAKTGEAEVFHEAGAPLAPAPLPAVRSGEVGPARGARRRRNGADGRHGQRGSRGRALDRAVTARSAGRRCSSSSISASTGPDRRPRRARSRSRRSFRAIRASKSSASRGYPGHCRGERGDDPLATRGVRRVPRETRDAFLAAGLRCDRISGGSTPTRFLTHETCVNELRSGTYALLDRTDGSRGDRSTPSRRHRDLGSRAGPGGHRRRLEDVHVGRPSRRRARDHRGLAGLELETLNEEHGYVRVGFGRAARRSATRLADRPEPRLRLRESPRRICSPCATVSSTTSSRSPRAASSARRSPCASRSITPTSSSAPERPSTTESSSSTATGSRVSGATGHADGPFDLERRPRGPHAHSRTDRLPHPHGRRRQDAGLRRRAAHHPHGSDRRHEGAPRGRRGGPHDAAVGVHDGTGGRRTRLPRRRA